MTKRFTMSSESNQNIWDTKEHCYYSSIDAGKLLDVLNELSDENEQLKQQLSNVQTLCKSTDDNLFACRKTNNELRECYSKLEKENEQLSHDANVLIQANKEYRIENEQLKEEIKDFQDILARKEEELLKPVIKMIDDKMEQCALFGESKCAVALSELRKEITEK